MGKRELFIKYHWTSFLVLLVVVVVVISFGVVVEDTDWLQSENGIVKGEATINSEIKDKDEAVKANQKYQLELRKIVQDYFQQRAEFITENHDWLFLINNAKYKLMGLSVPNAYHDLHLQLILAFDLEKQAITLGDNVKLQEVNAVWKNILTQYYWLESY